MQEENEKSVRKFSEQLEVLYELFNWKWYHGEPTAIKIENTIYELLHELRAKKPLKEMDSIATGGLRVEYEGEGMFSVTWSIDKSIYLTI